MSRLETIDRENVEDFLATPNAVLMLGKSTCEACKVWEAELREQLDGSSEWEGVRFGKLLLDQRGLHVFKRANPWLAEVDVLPYNVIYHDGEIAKRYAGGGMDRLSKRLGKVFGTDA